MATDPAPIITIDGPGGSGKGTVSAQIAAALHWHFLDSGALYRLMALAARRRGLSLGDEAAVTALAEGLNYRFEAVQGGPSRILMAGEDVSEAIRGEGCGGDASAIAALPRLRHALLAQQRAFHRPPGLVADGRDMGTVVFPQADLKIYLTASREERAERRYKQLKEKGVNGSLTDLLQDIVRRDERDHSRRAAPMRPAIDAVVVDTTTMSIEAVVARILDLWRDKG